MTKGNKARENAIRTLEIMDYHNDAICKKCKRANRCPLRNGFAAGCAYEPEESADEQSVQGS